MIKSLLSYFHPLNRLQRDRQSYLATQASHIPASMQPLLETPELSMETMAVDLDYIVLDFETTGLDPEQDLILSIGWVEIKNGFVDLASSSHFYISDESQVKPETAVINHITPQMLSEGLPIDDAIMAFMEEAHNKVLVAHGSVVEANFLRHYLKQRYRILDMPLLWIDTMCLEKVMARNVNMHEDLDLTLASTRARYGLPEYNAHNALADAVATAELLLVQKKRLMPTPELNFARLYKVSES